MTTIRKYSLGALIFLRIRPSFLFFLAFRNVYYYVRFHLSLKEKKKKRRGGEKRKEEEKGKRGIGGTCGKTRNAGLKEEKCTTLCVDFIFHASHVSS